jgi:RNA polymerase sigma factor (sigma-70 family)
MAKSSTHLTDDQFISGLKANNNEILNALYKKYYHLVLKLVVNNSGNSDLAQDLYQETIIAVYENVQKPQFQLNCQLQTYIYSIAKRLWLKQLKKNGNTYLFKEEEENDLVDVTEDVGFHLEKENNILKMNTSLGLLGEPCKTLIQDFYVNKKSLDEIAEKFGYTNADNAKTQKYKCLQRLKKYFFEKEIELNE